MVTFDDCLLLPKHHLSLSISTVDSLKDADLKRMCLLGVLMMNNHIQGSKVPQCPHFGGLNRHFKPNMRKIQIAISSDLCIRLTWNLTGSCGLQQRLRGWSRMVVKQFQDGGRSPFWKSLYRHISVNNHKISIKFCTQQQILNWMNVTYQKWKSCIEQTPSSTEHNSYQQYFCTA